MTNHISEKPGWRRDLNNIKRLARYFRSHWKYVYLAGIFTLVNVLLQLPMPLFTRYIIDTVLPGKNSALLNWVVLALAGFMVVNGVSEILNGYYLTLFRVKVVFNIQLQLFQHIQALGIRYFNNTQSGYLTSRITNDASNLHGLMGNTLLNGLKDILTFMTGAVVIFVFHWKLAVISIAILPLFIFSIKYFSKKIRATSHQFQEGYSRIFEVIRESFASIHLTKLFQLEKYNAGNLVGSLKYHIKTTINVNLLHSASGFVTAFIGGLGPLVVLWYGGNEVIQGNLSLGTLVAFSAFLGYILGPAQRIVQMNAEIQNSLASVERLFELFDLVPEIAEPKMPKEFANIRGKVEFKEVFFSYGDLETEAVLSNISLTAEPGSTVALVGKSGVGKTTLVNLIPRFYDPRGGVISIDGVNIKDISLTRLRKNIGVVPQDVFLYNVSIKENIRCGRRNASDDEIVEAAGMANAHDFILKLPQGYNTVVGERGVRLSGVRSSGWLLLAPY